jgi:hypothetical protein
MAELRAADQPYNFDSGVGRLDVAGYAWFACDPYPTWYRWDGYELITDPGDIQWADGKDDDGA